MKMGTAPRAGKLPLLLAALFATATGLTALATDVYTWTDENGVVHFSDTQPQATETRTLRIKEQEGGTRYAEPAAGTSGAPPAPGSEPVLTAAQQKRQQIAERRNARLEQKAETEAMCERHRKRLEQMEPARRVYYFDENGEQVRMDDVQRVSLIEESRNYLSENCH